MEIPKLNQELSNTLYQYMKKEHLDLENELSDDEWGDFLDDYQDCFAEKCSEIANDLFGEFLIDKKEDFEEEWTTSITLKDKYESIKADNADYFVQEGEE